MAVEEWSVQASHGGIRLDLDWQSGLGMLEHGGIGLGSRGL